MANFVHAYVLSGGLGGLGPLRPSWLRHCPNRLRIWDLVATII